MFKQKLLNGSSPSSLWTTAHSRSLPCWVSLSNTSGYLAYNRKYADIYELTGHVKKDVYHGILCSPVKN